MASNGVTATGLKELAQAIDNFPREVQEALRSVAWRSSRNVKDRALQILNSKTNGKADRIAAITIVEDAAEHVFHVIAEGPADKPANLALWFERGTRFMEARPFMRPAGDAEQEPYRQQSVAASTRVADTLGKY